MIPYLETDLDRIRELARERDQENREFRRKLKDSDMPRRAIDAMVHRLYREVASGIDCTKCANCCRELVPALDRRDVRRLSGAAGVAEDRFEQEFRQKAERPGKFLFNRKPCPFLDGTRCRYYDARPKACVGFPFLDRRDFTGRTIMVLWNYPYCPIVFNVVELLKAEFDITGPRRRPLPRTDIGATRARN